VSQPIHLLDNERIMLKILALLVAVLLAPTAAQALPPVITAPAGANVVQGIATALPGISVAEPGASPVATYTAVLTDTSGLLSATGTATVTGAGTNSLTIHGTLATTNVSLATVTDTAATAGLDSIAIAVTDSTSQTATPVNMQVSVAANANTYLIFSTQAAALTRAQTQCAALICDGTFTKYWWNVVGPLAAGTAGVTAVTAGSYAVEIHPSGPFAAVNNFVPACAVGCGLSGPEQATLVTAVQITPLLPIVIGP
jgi:hypothetical protein